MMNPERLVTWGTIASAVVGFGIAFGQQSEKIRNLEQQAPAVELIKQQTAEAKADLARVDERTKSIQEGQQRQEQMLQLLLEKLQ